MRSTGGHGDSGSRGGAPPYRGHLGRADAVLPVRPLAEPADVHLQPGVAERDVDRWVHSACVLCSNGCGLDIAVKDDRMVGVRGREHDRVNAGRLGPKGLLGWQGQQRGPAATPPGPPRRAAAGDRLGRRHGHRRAPLPGAAGHQGPVVPRLLHLGPADARGVLHARGHRQGRDRDPAHGRQHAAVHRDGGGRPQGVVRHRRSARQLHRPRPLRRDVPLRAQRRRDADGALGADAGPAGGLRPTAARHGRPAPDRGGPTARPSTCRSDRAPTSRCSTACCTR